MSHTFIVLSGGKDPTHESPVASRIRTKYKVRVQQHPDLMRHEQVAQAFIRKGHSNRALIALWILRSRSTTTGLSKLIGSVTAALVVLHRLGII